MGKAKGGGAAVAEEKKVTRIPVEFSNVSIGDNTASIGIKFEREWLSLSKADANLCGRRITGCIIVGSADPNQATFLDNGDFRIDGTFDVKRLGVSPKQYSIRLTFAMTEIDVGDLSHFAKQKGRLFIESSEELPAAAQAATESDGEERDDDEASDEE